MFDIEPVVSYVVEEARIYPGPGPETCGYYWIDTRNFDVATTFQYHLMLELLKGGASLKIAEPYIVADFPHSRVVLHVEYMEFEGPSWRTGFLRDIGSWLHANEFPWVDSFKYKLEAK